MNLITIIAIDRNSSDSMSRTFSINSIPQLKTDIEKFESELPYRKYELMCDELMEDYNENVIELLDELDVTQN